MDGAQKGPLRDGAQMGPFEPHPFRPCWGRHVFNYIWYNRETKIRAFLIEFWGTIQKALQNKL